jgi:anthrone oxygenase-like protein
MGAVQNGAEMLATLCCSLFAGAAVYINLVEHPARMECGPEVAMAEFPPSYRRATLMQASLAILGFVLSVAAWIEGANLRWPVGGALLVAVVPFTLIVIMPVNRRLLDPTLTKRSPEAAQLLSRWGRLHAVRSVLSVLALLVFLTARF